MTVVISHGWKSSISEWPMGMAAQLIAKGINANIVAWDWQQDANTARPTTAINKTEGQGNELADALATALGINYNQKLHFIGHSLGSLVNRHAVDALHANGFDANDTHVTILDAAELGDLDSQPWANPIPEQAAWIDNYITAFGSLHGEAANVILREGIPISFNPGAVSLIDELFDFHSFAHEWYNTSIQRPNDSSMGHKNSFERGTLGTVPVPGPGSTFVQTLSPFDDTLELSQITYGEGENIIRGRNLIYAGEAGLLLLNAVNAPIEFVGDVTSEVVEKIVDGVAEQTLRLVLNEHSPSYTWLPISIPANAVGLSFDFRFDGTGTSDYLTVGIDEELLFAIAGSDVPGGLLVNTGFLDVTDWANQNVEMFIGLNSDGTAGGRMTIEAITFHTAVPEPGSIILLAVAVMAFLVSGASRRTR
jgi:pimeloyl-ACP methyl ester carboxylesterase